MFLELNAIIKVQTYVEYTLNFKALKNLMFSWNICKLSVLTGNQITLSGKGQAAIVNLST